MRQPDRHETKELQDSYIYETEELITQDAILNSAAKVLPPDTILLAMYGATVGKLGRLAVPSACNQACAAMIVDEKLADSNFLFYQLLAHREQIKSLASGAAQQNLSGIQIKRFILPFPPLLEQRDIGSVLRALDDKIELNRRMNETLEQMAQAIFKDWFVDFGPVRRKQQGVTDPVAIMGGLVQDAPRAAELAALFPEFLCNGLPEGWTNQAIGALVETVGGATPSTSDTSLWEPGGHFWATPKDLSTNSDPVLFATERRISSAGLARISSGLLPAGTVLLSSRAPIGYLTIAQVPVAINQGFIALKPNSTLGSSFLYLWCKTHMDKVIANANGSTFQEISKKNFRPIASPFPNKMEVLPAINGLIDLLFARIAASVAETLTLAETRNYLLPKLMSGEVRVHDAEAFL
jgi:type I restriction enzyme S subunit